MATRILKALYDGNGPSGGDGTFRDYVSPTSDTNGNGINGSYAPTGGHLTIQFNPQTDTSVTNSYLRRGIFYFEVYLGSYKIGETVDTQFYQNGTNYLTVNWKTSSLTSYALTQPFNASSPIRVVVRTSPAGPVSGTIGQFRTASAEHPLEVVINYEQSTTAPGAPYGLSLSQTSASPNQEVELRWSAPDPGAHNSISSYNIYRGTSSYNLSFLENTGSTSTSHTVTAPSSPGANYYFAVQAKGSVSGYTEGAVSSAVGPLTSQVSNAGSISNFTINNSNSNIYVTSNDEITFNWSAASSSDSNPIKNYRIEYRSSNNNSFAQLAMVDANTLSYKYHVPEDGATYYYRVIPIAQYGEGGASPERGVTSISMPQPPTINHNYPSVTKNNVTISWNAPSSITGASYSYNVGYFYNNATQLLIEKYTGTSYSFDISKIAPNGVFQIYVATVAQSSNGSALISSNANTNPITKSPDFEIADNFWKNCYDPTNEESNEKGLQSWGYKEVFLEWYPVVESGNTFTYDLKYKANIENQWNNILSNSSSTSATLSLTQFASGTSFEFKVTVRDAYGTTRESIYPNNFIKITPPKLSNVSIIMENYPTAQLNYHWDFSDGSNDRINYACYLSYNGVEKLIRSGQHNIAEGNKNVNWSFNYSLKPNSGSILSTNDDLYKALYKEVITNKNSIPMGNIRVRLAAVGYSDCYVEMNYSFNYNFITSIIAGALTFSGQSHGSGATKYYNSGDRIDINFSSAKFEDAAGGIDGATIQYIINGNGGTSGVLQVDQIYSDYAPKANNDLTVSYTVTAEAIYANGNKISHTSPSYSINVARWSELEEAYLSSVESKDGQITGSLVIGNGLFSSKNYRNISSITYTLYDLSQNDRVVAKNQDFPISSNLNTSVIAQSFSYEYDATENLQLYAKIIATNTSGAQIVKTTTAYMLRSGSVPLAIRKNRIGINVNSSDFNLNANDDIKNSALYVAGGSEAAPVVEISTNGANKDLIVCYYGDKELGRIIGRGENALSIVGLTHVFEKEGNNNLKLNANNWWLDVDSGFYIYRIQNNYITENTIQEILPAVGITENQLMAFQDANLIGGYQDAGWCDLICFGERPTIDIPITLIVRGG